MIEIDDAADIMQRVREMLDADRRGPMPRNKYPSIGLERYAFACEYCHAVYRPDCQPFKNGDGYGRTKGKPRTCQRRALQQELDDAEEELREWLGMGPGD